MAPTRSAVHIQGADFMAVWQQGKDIKELRTSRRTPRRCSMSSIGGQPRSRRPARRRVKRWPLSGRVGGA